MKRIPSYKVISLAACLSAGLVQNAHASSTMVTDAIGTQQLWTFQEILGAQKLVSKINQVDGKGISQTWDANGNMLTRTDSEGRTTSYTYNASNQRISMTEAEGTPEARVTNYDYINADVDLVTKVTSPSVFDGAFKEVVTTYDANLNVTAVVINGLDLSGSVVSRSTTFSHDSYGKVLTIDGPRTDLNDTTTFAYHDCNTGAECGQLQSVTNALGHQTTYDAYDAAARLLQSTDPNGVVTSYSYHPRGWVLGITKTPSDGAARTTSYEYDSAGQITKVTFPDGAEQNYVYDAAHDLREISDNLGNTVEYTYDAKGNRTHELIKDPDGTLVRSSVTSYDIRNFVSSINNAGSVTQLINDAVGNLSTQTDPNQNPSTSNTYDALNRLTGTVDALTNITGYQFNVADQLAEVVAPNGAITLFEYDDLGNQTEEISADRGTVLYSHDAAGNVISMADARGIITTYNYDALNRLTNVSYPNSTENIVYTYDSADCTYGVGRLCVVEDDSGVDSYDYDPWGNISRCEKEERDGNDAAIGVYVTEYQYDDANRVAQITYPSGRTVTNTRDSIGRLSSITTTDLDGKTTNIITSRSYRADSLWTQQTYGNGLVQTKTYDQQGRLIDHIAGGYQRQYGYDANGNIIGRSALDNSADVDYTYDPLDRLTEQSDVIRGLVRGYGYDANGNRTDFSENTQNSSLVYESNSNRLSDVGGNDVALDASGRITQDAQGRDYFYNNAGRLRELMQAGVAIAGYVYNSQQLRTQKIIDSSTILYHYDQGGNLISESDQSGLLIQEYIYADGERVGTFVAGTNADDNNGDDVPAINLSAHIAYGGAQDDSSSGAVSLANNETQITLNGNRWRAVPLTYTVTPNTVLSFDFSSTTAGEIHGIGFDNDLGISQDKTFQLFGTQNWGINGYRNYTDGTQQYVIPVGQFYQGAMSYLTFTMDDDSNKVGNATFANVKVYEQSSSTSGEIIDLAGFQPYGGSQDQSTTGPVELLGDGALRLKGNRWQKVAAPIVITPTMELHFEFRSDTQGEIHSIGVDDDNNLSPTRTFSLWGSQNWGNRTSYGYSGSGDYQTYQIPIGQYLIGGFSHLTFAMDDDLNANAESVFRNVQFIDPANPPQPESSSNIHFYVNDHLNTPQRLVDENSDISWQAEYAAFGIADISVERVTNNHRFPGQYFDEESGLYYNWNRYYNPTLGRYVTSDPIGLDGGLNTYGYVEANPLLYFDEEGLVASKALKCLKNPRKCRKDACNALNVLMHLYCDSVRSCKGGDSCKVLKSKKTKFSRCIKFRNLVSRCHGKKNDPNPSGHKQAIEQLRNRIKKCERLLGQATCCS